jgi:hypothetical protein
MIIGKRKVEKLRKQGENVRVYLSGIKQALCCTYRLTVNAGIS